MIYTIYWKIMASTRGGVALTALVSFLYKNYLMKGWNQNAEKKNIGRASFSGYGDNGCAGDECLCRTPGKCKKTNR